ncbi:MAG: TIGR01212 family radical SAM protein [Candidatus Lambdaproteobacteria bacterium]|nr:TIGR01212 family radical SAM protein [Candidatus Lambdaproteobacteria bacterium]
MSAAPAPEPRYLPLSRVYRERFGCKVYKLPVSIAQTCPNREGLRGMRPCIFCDEWGAAAYPEHAGRTLGEQLRLNGARIRARYGAERFLVYFQAYTNTFAGVGRLAALFEQALATPGVAGLVVGTRPDCLPPAVLALLADLARAHYVSVELGVQTLDDAQLAWLARGHTREQSLRALAALAGHPALDVCAHLMFGLPGETEPQLRETARELSRRGVAGVKLHNLHVLRATPLEHEYRAGAFTPVTLATYAERVVAFLEALSPHIAIHRLNAVASRWDDVVAPDWAREKLRPAEAIRRLLRERETWQGRLYAEEPPLLAALPVRGATLAEARPWG